jgi:hypothetical protein
MCNLYSITTNQAAIIALFRVINRYIGNLPPMPGAFPDYPAPVVQRRCRPRTGLDALGHAATAARRRPHLVAALAALAEAGKPLLGCLVPFNSFAEYAPESERIVTSFSARSLQEYSYNEEFGPPK